mmetsp:Transcript_26108/g.32624  ORF Transcript_26108/g.32624 Transcript_26108/m.32624 type:complete len:155 (+) Transcript_26108:652-1116(+)|eukprot:CAMPEP_0170464628 /NCGR_PEP_ID=MMETSP0123-20130129/9279_1 /TAXON_ID=182087 /ORGANISM="Favella ehrenbergii, Strain Fehren 1" /LENGTH=154 /DNA_ID=CAMNT_0010730329 /DNA_START=645 /DNA_END=1109 /DNA_ORIENTATION=+
MSSRLGKTMAGVARAAYNTGSLLIDSGMGSDVEKFAMRRGVKLLGVCPEAEVTFPKISNRQPNELTNGHTHFFLIGREDRSLNFTWGDESCMKYDLAQRISKGRVQGMGASGSPPCKMITVIIGDNEAQAMRDIEASMNMKVPIIVVRGTPLTD